MFDIFFWILNIFFSLVVYIKLLLNIRKKRGLKSLFFEFVVFGLFFKDFFEFGLVDFFEFVFNFNSWFVEVYEFVEVNWSVYDDDVGIGVVDGFFKFFDLFFVVVYSGEYNVEVWVFFVGFDDRVDGVGFWVDDFSGFEFFGGNVVCFVFYVVVGEGWIVFYN